MSDERARLEAFFPVFGDMLDRVQIPGMAGASWDRKAAYLLLVYGTGKPDFVPFVEWVQKQPKG